MGEAALAYDAAGDAAAESAANAAARRAAFRVIQGGAGAAETGAGAAAGAGEVAAGAAAGEAAAGAAGEAAAVAAGEAVAVTTGAVVAIAAVAAVAVVGLGLLGYYLYKRSQSGAEPNANPDAPPNPNPPDKVDCPLKAVEQNPPGNPQEPLPVPDAKPKPVPLDQRIPEPNRSDVRRKKEDRNKKRCGELAESIQKRTNRRRKKPGSGTAGMRYRYWDMLCSEFDPTNTQKGQELWDGHKQAYESDQRGLKNDLDEFEQKCEGQLPDGARTYADEPFPDKSKWRGNSPECQQYRKEREARYKQYENDPNADND